MEKCKTISIVGDVMIGRSFDENLKIPVENIKIPMENVKIPVEYVKIPVENVKIPVALSKNVVNLLKKSDYWLMNLETSITNSKQVDKLIPNKAFNFKLSPEKFDTVLAHLPSTLGKQGKIMVNIANNHILDYGIDGLKDTIETLGAYGICSTGSKYGHSSYCVTDDIVLIGFSDHPKEWKSIINLVDLDYPWVQVAEINKIGKMYPDKILIVYLHWGTNWPGKYSPSFKHERFAKMLIDNGATIVVGTSPHHLQQYDFYKNGVIFYSLGDFVDDYAIDYKWRNDLAVVANVDVCTFGKGKSAGGEKYVKHVKFYPTRIDNMQVSLLDMDKDYNLVMSNLLKF